MTLSDRGALELEIFRLLFRIKTSEISVFDQGQLTTKPCVILLLCFNESTLRVHS